MEGEKNRTFGRAFRLVHFLLAAVAVALTLFGPRALAPYLLVLWISVVVVNLLYGGCPLTALERHMTQENVTIVDPFLDLFHLDYKHRATFTLAVSSAMLVVSAIRS